MILYNLITSSKTREGFLDEACMFVCQTLTLIFILLAEMSTKTTTDWYNIQLFTGALIGALSKLTMKLFICSN